MSLLIVSTASEKLATLKTLPSPRTNKERNSVSALFRPSTMSPRASGATRRFSTAAKPMKGSMSSVVSVGLGLRWHITIPGPRATVIKASTCCCLFCLLLLHYCIICCLRAHLRFLLKVVERLMAAPYVPCLRICFVCLFGHLWAFRIRLMLSLWRRKQDIGTLDYKKMYSPVEEPCARIDNRNR